MGLHRGTEEGVSIFTFVKIYLHRSGTCEQTKRTYSVVRLVMVTDTGESSEPSSKSVKTHLMDLLTKDTVVKGVVDNRSILSEVASFSGLFKSFG